MNNILNDDPTAFHKVLTTYTNEELREIAKHGCASGVAHSHLYYSQTCEFYDEFEDQILTFLEDVSDQNPLHHLSEDCHTIQELKNKVVWNFVDLLASVHSPE